MAYSAIEQRYINLLTTAAFPDAVDEPEPMAAEPSLDGVQLAAGPAQTRTDAPAGVRVGRGGVRYQPPSMSDITTPLTGLADIGAGVARGAVAQTLGLGGDLQSLYNGLKAVFNRPEDQGRLDAFIAGMEANTLLPTTEDMNKILPPVVPPGAADEKNRTFTANVGQIAGEFAPLPTAIDLGIKGTKAAVKGAKKAGAALAPKVGGMVESYLTKTGAILKMTPDRPGIEVPVAPKLNTPTFKNWFGDSKVVDETGKPVVMYHGTSRNFEQFRRGVGNDEAIFVSPDPNFAGSFAGAEYTVATGGTPNVIPLYVRASNPFDFDNPKHRAMVIDLAIQEEPLYRTAPDQDGMRRVLNDALTNKNANWSTLEEAGFQKAIKALGFDSFYVREEGIKNLAVYNPEQLKSVFNKGTWDPKDPRILHGGAAATGAAATKSEEKK